MPDMPNPTRTANGQAVRLAVLMDPIQSIKPAKDSTLAMLLAAQARGWTLLYMEQRDTWLRDGVAWGRLRSVKVRDDARDWFELGEPKIGRLGELDVILMRKDPPFDTEYIYSTYILERAEAQGVLVANSPRGLRDINEKVYTAWFPQCCAPTLITRDMADMGAFLAEHGKAVCKPLDGMGGQSIFVIEQGEKNANVIFETLTHHGRRYAIVQKYLPEIVDGGDARILLLNGDPLEHALARIPMATDHRGNMAAGGRAEARPLNERERWLCAQVGPVMREKGMLFVGLDVIGDYVTEINVTSPTGIRELDKQVGLDVGDRVMEVLVRRLCSASHDT